MSPTAAVVVSQTLRRRRDLTEQAASAAVDQACRRLRLPTIPAVLDEAVSVGHGQMVPDKTAISRPTGLKSD
jgi:hypothetical protein